MPKKDYHKLLMPYVPWLLISIFYLYQYILRVVPGVMADELFASFPINAKQLASLGVIPTIAYGCLQIPLGILLDRFGLRRIIIPSMVLCAVGCSLFGVAEQFWCLQLSRLLVGIGSACSFLGAVKAAADNFSPAKRVVLLGATLSLGSLGPLICSKLLGVFLAAANWRLVFYYLGAINVLIILSTYIYLPHAVRQQHPHSHILAEVIAFCKNRTIMLYTVIASGLYAPMATFCNLWGKAFLQRLYNLDPAEIMNFAVLPYLGLGLGSVLVPWCSRRCKNHSLIVACCSFAIMMLFVVVIYATPPAVAQIVVILCFIGVLCGCEMLCFDGALLCATKGNYGQLTGMMNTINVLLEASLGYCIGLSLDLQWHGTFSSTGGRLYTAAQFQNSFAILVIFSAICFFASLLLLKGKDLNQK